MPLHTIPSHVMSCHVIWCDVMRFPFLGIAYHNLGVEEEFLKHYDACLEWYEKAYQLAIQYVGENQPITNTFAQSLKAAQKVKLYGVMIWNGISYHFTSNFMLACFVTYIMSSMQSVLYLIYSKSNYIVSLHALCTHHSNRLFTRPPHYLNLAPLPLVFPRMPQPFVLQLQSTNSTDQHQHVVFPLFIRRIHIYNQLKHPPTRCQSIPMGSETREDPVLDRIHHFIHTMQNDQSMHRRNNANHQHKRSVRGRIICILFPSAVSCSWINRPEADSIKTQERS